MKTETEAGFDDRKAGSKVVPKAGFYRLYVLLLLTAVYTFNFIDRQIMGIIAPAIQADLKLADWQLGLLLGPAFAVLYAVMGIPIARLADRWNRVSIITIALICWSGFTALSGFAQNFGQLALARIGVGIGEAGGSPPSHSLISDLYPKEKRAGALSVYALGIPIGITLAYLGGGWITQAVGWREAFFLVGVPGIALALLLKLTVAEPKRGHLKKGPLKKEDGKQASQISVWEAAKHLFSIRSYRLVVCALTAGSFVSYSVGNWIVVFFQRTHPDFSIYKVFIWLGILSGTAYVMGAFLGGRIVDRLALKNRSAYGLVPAVAFLILLPCFLMVLWVGNAPMALVFFWPVNLLFGIYLGPSFALAQTLAPVSMRAFATAISFFVINLIALGMGPAYIGFISNILSDAFNLGDVPGLRWALTSTVIVLMVSIILFWRLSKSIEADWKTSSG